VAGGSEESGRSVASRVTAILMAFRSGGTHSLSELAGLAGLPVSTTHRLVGELVSRRVLERTAGGGYRVGLPLRMIGAGSAQPAPPLLDRGLVVIADLAEAARTTVRIGVLTGTRLSVATAEPRRAPSAGFTADPEPAYRSALGRALLAFSPTAVVDEVLLLAREHRTAAGAEQLRRILAMTRRTRVAIRRNERGAVCALAVPVFGTGGTVLAALEAAVADVHCGLPAVRSALLIAAGSLSRELATAPRPGSAPDSDPAADTGTGTDSEAG
jgi:DNA-binding IclR family transcriptional regulator